MNEIIEQSHGARRDFIRILAIAGEANRSAPRRLRLAAEKTLRQIAAMPGMGELHDPGIPDLPSIRRCAMTGYTNYLVYYSPIEGGIRVIHAAREPEALIDVDDFD